MNVLSLFDGMSCGQIALQRMGVEVTSYTASEIDKAAIKVTQANFPNTIQVGDVTKVHVTNAGIEVDLPSSQMRTVGYLPDLILAGSPCQGLSKAGKMLGLKDPRSALFYEFVRILDEAKICNPNVLFLLENVEMSKQDELTISKILGIRPIKINSTLVSAQNRVRLYWTNVAIEPNGLFGHDKIVIPQPKDKKIFLRDVLQPEREVKKKYYLSEQAMSKIKYGNFKSKTEKAKCFTAGGNSGGNHSDMTVVSGIVNSGTHIREVEKSTCLDANYHKGLDKHAARTGIITYNLQPRTGKGNGGKGPLSKMDGKSYALSTQSGGNAVERVADIATGTQGNRIYSDKKAISINSSGGGYGGHTGIFVIDLKLRRLTPIECCRLQTVPDDYFFKEGKQIIADTPIYRCLGNGWTVDVICHILQHMNIECPTTSK